MKIIAITQARYGSTRLPAKILKKIEGITLLEIHLKRILKSKKIDQLIVATTIEDEAKYIIDIAQKLNVKSFQGSVNDVLARFYYAALPQTPDYIVRLTSDCPLIDPILIDEIIHHGINANLDYFSNTLNPTYPDGEDIEIFKFSALEKAFKEATLKSDREHVTPFIWRNSTFKGGDIFKSDNFENTIDYSDCRMTVDTEDDFQLIEKLITLLGNDRSWQDYATLLKDNPEIKNINSMYERNEGYKQSLINDKVSIQGTGQLLYEQAKKVIPGGTQLLSKRPEQFLPDLWPAYYQKAKGCEVWDIDGNKFLDMSYMGIGACSLGYADDDVNKSVMEAVINGNMCTLNSPEEVELAHLMLELHPWAQMVRYARGGGEAMSMAVRIARASTKKDIILFSGYHGWHDWYLSANLSDSSALDGQLLPGLSPIGVARNMKGTSYPFYYNNTEEFLALIEKYGSGIGGIVMEAIRNIDPDPSFLNTIRETATKLNIPLIIDEVSSGFRLNTGGAHLILGIEPDIAVFAKGISNGYPMAIVMGKKEFMDAAQDSFISSTYWSERIGPVAALATIKKMISCNVQQHLIKCGEKVQKGWMFLAKKHLLNIHVGSIYPMSHFDFIEHPLVLKTLFTQEMLYRGFLATNSFYACYAHNDDIIDQYLEAVDKVFEIITEGINKGNIEALLKGPVCQSGFKRIS